MVALSIRPAHSDCGSIASDDLDALLEAQGSLSHWPTPPTEDDNPQDVYAQAGSGEDGLDCNVDCLSFENSL